MTKTILACLLFAFALSACNTMQGAGQDIKAAGDDLSTAAEKTKEKINGQ